MAGANKVQFLEDNLPVTMYELNIRCWDQRGTVSTGTYKAYMGSCSESEALHMVLFEPYGRGHCDMRKMSESSSVSSRHRRRGVEVV
ncbi:hypothetical protein MLD38_009214 [Melastoma candidum]|uniref:Uncharacterized protein n=1 Tax=Melastoma candidum TaxID=119954 RepID=A0ACB9RWS9_9MYRT|nr:hypothetical protein MLD38_009214 [Melastoma candidum]